MSETTTPALDWMIADGRVPLWLRVVALAYRDASPVDEVLYLEPGALAETVGHTGDRATLGRAVQRAVDLGYLTDKSGTMALRLAAREGLIASSQGLDPAGDGTGLSHRPVGHDALYLTPKKANDE